MNILDVEDMVKGLPDQRLQQEAQAPTGQVPQFLVISEIQRRTDMRKRFSDQQQQAPQGTVKDQVVQQGIAAIAPPDPQMQAAMGAPVPMAAGRGVPFAADDPRMQYLQQLKDKGVTYDEVMRRLGGMYYNTAGEASVQSVTDQPTSTVMPPNTQGVGSVMENIPMTDIVRPGNAAYDALQQVFGSQAPVVDAMGDFEPTPRDPEEYDTNRRFYPNTSPAMRQRMVDRALAVKPSQAFLDELSAGSRERRNRQPSEAVGTFSAPQTAYTQEMYDENVGGFRNVVDQDPSQYPDIKPFPVTDVDRMYASELSKMTGETVTPQGTDPKLAARTRQLQLNEYGDLLRQQSQARRDAEVAGPAIGDTPKAQMRAIMDRIAERKQNPTLSGTKQEIMARRRAEQEALVDSASPKPVATNAQETDASRVKPEDLTPDALSAILAPNAAGNAPQQTFNQQFGINLTDYTETKDRNRGGDAGTSVQGTGATGLKSNYEKIVEQQMKAAGDDIFNASDLYGEALGLADLIENQKRPTLSYKALVDEYEAETQKQLADIKSERGAQSLIALGAGIARGKLGEGLSEAGKVVAASNAQKRAVEAKDRAARLGLKKSEMDAAFASEIDKQKREVEAQKVRIAGLKDYNVSQAAAEKTVLGMQANLQEFLLKVDKEEGDRLDREALNERAVLQYVTSAMDDLISDGMTPDQKTDIADFLIQQATSMMGVIYKGPKFSQIGKPPAKDGDSKYQVERVP